MARNLALTGGLYNSQELLLTLCNQGLSRVDAYAIIQRNALKAHSEGLDFKTLLLQDSDLKNLVTPEIIEAAFKPDRFLAHVDTVFTRVFG